MSLDTALQAATPIRNAEDVIIGTGVAIAAGLVLTALHVPDSEPVRSLQVGSGLGVAGSACLPVRQFGHRRDLARESYLRSRALGAYDGGTVDLALLAVPDLQAPRLTVRATPVQVGERIAVCGYPGGAWTVTLGPVTSCDDADFVAHLVLGSGGSGSPAIDSAGRLAGLATLDHADAGCIFIGPLLLGTFLERTPRLLAHLLPRTTRR